MQDRSLKETYFSVLLNKNSQKFVRFQWSGNIYQFLCLCFGLGLAPIFTKLLKVPTALLRRVNIRIIIYLDEMLLMGRTLPEILMARDTLVFLLQHLGFAINLKKSVLHPVKQIEFLVQISNRYRENDFRSFREKIKTCVSTMSGYFQATKNFNLKSHKINWPVIINCPDHFTSLNPVLISSTGANIGSIEKSVLQRSCDAGEFSKGGTPLVDGKLETLQWEENSAMRTPYDYSDRCLNKRLGGMLQGSFDRGEMVKGEKAFSINVLL